MRTLTLLLPFLFLLTACKRPSPEPEATASTSPQPPENITKSWPGPRGGPELQGRVHEPLFRNPEVAWTFTGDSGFYADPAVADGIVYAGTVMGTLYAIDENTGDLIWSIETGDTIEATPTVAHGKLFVGSNDYKLRALDAKTGEELWDFEIAEKFSAGANVVKSPDGQEDWLLINGYDGIARCLLIADGSQVWEYKTEQYINGAPAIVDGSNVVFGGCDKVIHNITLAKGQLVNEVVTDSHITSSVATFDRMVYAGNHANQVVAADAFGENLTWIYQGSEFPFFGSPAVTETGVYIGSRDKNLHAIDRLSGQGLWKFKTGGRIDGSPLAFDDAILFASGDGRLYAVAPDGQELWTLELGEDFQTAPAYANQTIYLGGTDETLFAIKSKEPR